MLLPKTIYSKYIFFYFYNKFLERKIIFSHKIKKNYLFFEIFHFFIKLDFFKFNTFLNINDKVSYYVFYDLLKNLVNFNNLFLYQKIFINDKNMINFLDFFKFYFFNFNFCLMLIILFSNKIKSFFYFLEFYLLFFTIFLGNSIILKIPYFLSRIEFFFIFSLIKI
jgi:hypothetical protein